MSDLKKEAEALGIEVNPRWSDETLKKKIEDAKAGQSGTHEAAGTAPDPHAAGHELQGRQTAAPFGGKGDHDGDGHVGGAAPAKAAGEQKTSYELLRDYWDENGERVLAGTDVSLTDTEARRLGSSVLKVKSVFG